MARNEEKHAGRLNRLWLEQLDNEKREKNPPRPGLGSLNTAEEVKKWIPSIKKDIDFCLKQSQVGCYPERHIQDFSVKIDRLTKEYRAYIRKLRELEPQMGSIPWTDRPYTRKHKLTDNDSKQETKADQLQEGLDGPAKKSSRTSQFSIISTPILDCDDAYTQTYGFIPPQDSVVPDVSVVSNMQDEPLVFSERPKTDNKEGCDKHSSSEECVNEACCPSASYCACLCSCHTSSSTLSDRSYDQGEKETCQNACPCRHDGHSVSTESENSSGLGKKVACDTCDCRQREKGSRDTFSQKCVPTLPKDATLLKGHNPLNLAYSDSSSGDESE